MTRITGLSLQLQAGLSIIAAALLLSMGYYAGQNLIPDHHSHGATAKDGSPNSEVNPHPEHKDEMNALTVSSLNRLMDIVHKAERAPLLKSLSIPGGAETARADSKELEESVAAVLVELAQSFDPEHHEKMQRAIDLVAVANQRAYGALNAMLPVAAQRIAAERMITAPIVSGSPSKGGALLKVTVSQRPFGMHIKAGSTRVEEVFPGFPAQAAGVRKGCELKQVAGQEVGAGSWLDVFQKTPLPFQISLLCGSSASTMLTSNQNAERLSVPVVSNDAPHHGALSADPRRHRVVVSKKPYGMNIQVNQVPRVVEVLPGFPAEAAGIRKGFVLIEVNDKPVDKNNWFTEYQAAKFPFTLTFDTKVPVSKGNPFFKKEAEKGLVPKLDKASRGSSASRGFGAFMNAGSNAASNQLRGPNARLPTLPGMKMPRLTTVAPGQLKEVTYGGPWSGFDGSWYYGEGSHYKLTTQSQGITFEELEGKGLLTKMGDWYQGQLFLLSRDGYISSETQGFIRLRRAGNSIQSNFKKTSDSRWEPDITAMKRNEKDLGVGSRVEAKFNGQWYAGKVMKLPADDYDHKGRWTVQRDIDKNGVFTLYDEIRPVRQDEDGHSNSKASDSADKEVPKIGDRVKLADGREGYVFEVKGAAELPFRIGFDNGDVKWDKAENMKVLEDADEDEDEDEDDEDEDEKKNGDDDAADDDEDEEEEKEEEFPGAGFRDFQCSVEKVPFGMRIGAQPGRRPRVVDLVKGSPAIKAGVKIGDVLVEVAGRPVTSTTWFAAIQRASPPYGLFFRRSSRNGK